MREILLSGFWLDGSRVRREVLDRTGLWLDHKVGHVEILSLTYFAGKTEVSSAQREKVTSTNLLIIVFCGINKLHE